MDNYNNWLYKAKDIGDKVASKSKDIVPDLARLLIATGFIMEAVRPSIEWTLKVREDPDISRDTFISTTFVTVVYGLGLLAGAGMILIRSKVVDGLSLLVRVVCFQICASWISSSSFDTKLEFFLRKGAVFGVLYLVSVESRAEARTLSPGVPSHDQTIQDLKLGGFLLAWKTWSLYMFHKGQCSYLQVG